MTLEALPVAAAETADAVGIQRHLARRQDTQSVQPLPGHLRIRLEIPERVDLVGEQIDTDRQARTHRKHVEKRPAHRELAVFLDLRYPRVADRDERVQEVIARQRLAHAQGEGSGADVGGRRQALQ